MQTILLSMALKIQKETKRDFSKYKTSASAENHDSEQKQ